MMNAFLLWRHWEIRQGDTNTHSAVIPHPCVLFYCCSSTEPCHKLGGGAAAVPSAAPPHPVSSQSIFIISARLLPLLPVNLRRSPLERIWQALSWLLRLQGGHRMETVASTRSECCCCSLLPPFFLRGTDDGKAPKGESCHLGDAATTGPTALM